MVVPQADVPAVIFSNGMVLWIPPIRGKVRCDMNARFWPTDYAACDLAFGSTSTRDSMMHLNLVENNKNIVSGLISKKGAKIYFILDRIGVCFIKLRAQRSMEYC